MSRVSGQKACFFEMEQVLKSDNCFSAALKTCTSFCRLNLVIASTNEIRGVSWRQQTQLIGLLMKYFAFQTPPTVSNPSYSFKSSK